MSNNQLPADVQEKALAYSLKGSWVNYPHPHPGKMFYPGTGQSETYSRYYDGYIAGATAEVERLQPVIDALAQFIARHEGGLLPDRFTYEKGVKALEQWTGTGKDEDKCRCIQPNWNAFTGKCLTCGKH